MTSAEFCTMTSRFTFGLGVRSPAAMEFAIQNSELLALLQRFNCSLSVST